MGAVVLAHRVDVSDAEQVDAFAAAVHERFAGVDLLVNNAGVGCRRGLPPDRAGGLAAPARDQRHGRRARLPQLRPGHDRWRGSGQIVNVSSGAGFLASPWMFGYSTSKFAVFGLSEGLRMELRPHGVGVTTICPGFIDTPIMRTSVVRGDGAAERQEKLARFHARRGYGPDKVAVGILKAAQRNRAVAPVTPEARLSYVLSKVAPPVARWMGARMASALSLRSHPTPI